MEHDGAHLIDLARLFSDPGAVGEPTSTLAEDAEAAISDPAHEPEYDAVRTMLSIFPGLAPAHTPALGF